MNVKFDCETGLMYIYFSEGVPNTQMKTDHKNIFKFVAKANRDQIVGYEIENVEALMEDLYKHIALSRKQRLAVVLCYMREKQKKTQNEFSAIISVSISTYKSIERAEHNITFDTLDVIYNQFPEEELLHQIF
jgi:hypothetical protein